MSPLELGSVIRRERKAAGMNQTQLAEAIGCSQRFVSELERGKRTAELGLALRAVEALGLDLVVWRRSDKSASPAAVDDLVTQVNARLRGERKKRRKLAAYLEEEAL